jgi:hypothetical protein
MKYSILVLCAHGARCPELYYRDGKTWNRRHGSAGFACRIPTSLGIKQLKRYRYPSKADAENAAKTSASCSTSPGLTRSSAPRSVTRS